MAYVIGPFSKKDEADKLAEFIKIMNIGEVIVNIRN